ncbi:MAG: LD-carboxypeptidase, partial [Bdellovibrionaceae bacterium]|nr:LD-carboxypeptidase [Pseudobdellovibrionaceae bacterium]
MMDRRHPLNSSDRNIRFDYLKLALEEEQSDVIWCLRGGYGSIHLLPLLDSLKKPKKKKLLIGLSDITSLHIYLQQRWGWSTLHASHLDR